MSTRDVVVVNGKHYDAVTGAPLKAAPHSPNSGHHLDGIVAPVRKSTSKTSKSGAAHSAPTVKVKRPSLSDVRPSSHRSTHTPQPSRTLMRRAVTKPQGSLKSRSGLHATNLPAKRLIMEITPKPSITAIDNSRLKHAKAIPKSHLITRYNLDAVRAATPTMQVSQPSVSAIPSYESHPIQPAQPRSTAELLQRAVDRASSHEQAPHRPEHRSRHRTRIASVSTLAAVSVLLFGFVMYRNMPNLKLDLASSRAGFAASLPASQPAGFNLTQLTATTGQVTLNFRSTDDSTRHYSLVEKPSTWDSSTLRDVFVIGASNDHFQVVQVGGRTFYLYNQQHITWVNGGTWYQLNGDGALSTQQQIDIATSL